MKKILALLTFITFLNLFFFHSLGSVAFGLINLSTFLFITYIFKITNFGKKELISISCLLTVIALFSIGIVIRANTSIQTILGTVSIFVLLINAYLLSSQISSIRSLFELVLAPSYFIGAYIKAVFKTIKNFYSGDYKEIVPIKTNGGRTALVHSVIIGLFIGVFVIGILISMFSNADPIFASYAKNLLFADFVQNLYKRMIFSLFLFLALIPFMILKKSSVFRSPIRLFKRLNFTNEMSVIMILVAIVTSLFLIIQWPYVFVNVPFETDLSKFGVTTYSEYVRKGFDELLKISLFLYGLIWSGLIVLRENKSKRKNVLKYVQLVVIAEFIIFLFSIARRIWLYQEYHGWSLIRIYGGFFVFWIMGITIFLTLRHFWQKRWVIGEMTFTVFVIFLLGIINVESFIVKSHPPTVNKKVDYVYLSRLSADGYIGWEKAYNHAKTTIIQYNKRSSILTREERKETAYAGIIIRELLQNYKDLIKNNGNDEEIKEYLVTTFNFQKEVSMTQKQPEALYIKSIDEILKLIKKDRINYQKIFNYFFISRSPDKYQYWITNDYTKLSFYEIPFYNEFFINNLKTDKKVVASKLDRLYSWNASGAYAYKQMKKNINYLDLMKLQKQYFNLYKRITGQPVDQQSYDMDISLASPLLD